MRIALNVSGVLCLLVGCVWILQGVNVLPGSFMTGQTKWAIYGGLLAVAGIGLLVSANRRRVWIEPEAPNHPQDTVRVAA
jgi:hypothetical protein